MHRLFTIFLLVALTATCAFSQNMKWGKIPEADLKMTHCPLDSQAAAMILGDEGELSFLMTETRFRYRLSTHTRFKLFSTAGFEHGNVVVSYYRKDDWETVEKIDAQVTYPDGEKVKMKKTDVFFEDVDKEWGRVRFAVPGLKVGAVFEYRYDVLSENIDRPRKWNFQSDVPVRNSTLTLKAPEMLVYSYLINSGKLIQARSLGTSDEYLGPEYSARISNSEYTANNLPAVSPEPYVDCMDNFIASVELQLDKIVYSREKETPRMPTWPKFASELLENPHLGAQLSKEKFYEKAWRDVAPLVASLTEPQQKAEAIYHFLNKKLKWNEEFGIFIDKTLDDAYAKGTGSGSEMNLLLLACLRAAGVPADPVLISTRGHGWPIKLYPILRQFDHLIVQVRPGLKSYFMDLGNAARPPQLIRQSALNQEGFLLRPGDGSSWIKIETPTDQTAGSVTAQLQADGTLTGKVEKSHSNYNAVSLRGMRIEDGTLKNYQQKLEEKHPDLKLDSLSLTDKGSSEIIEQFRFSLPNAAQVVGDMIYFTPVFLTIFEENPFKSEKRVLPIEFPTQRRCNLTFNLEIPDGYEVATLPESANISAENEGFKFKISAAKTGRQVQMSLRMQIQQTYFEPEQYKALRQFYELVLAKQVEPIVLKKT